MLLLLRGVPTLARLPAMMGGMGEYLDLDRWPRRAAFDHFRAFDNPFFGVCTRIDAAPLRAALAGRGFAAACWFTALRLAHAIEPFRYRLDGTRVRVLPRVDGSTTVLRDDESFGFATLPWDGAGFGTFRARADAAVGAVRRGEAPFDPRTDEQALLHFTTLPWVHFTSFSHARCFGSGDSIPKVAFGRLQAEGDRLWMPLAVDVHHGLMDGLHVGRFIEGFETAFARPAGWLAT